MYMKNNNSDAIDFLTEEELNDLGVDMYSLLREAEMLELNYKCGLNHGCPEEENPLAVDYFCQNIGVPETGEIVYTIQIPICAECIASLYSEYQILLLCLKCSSSQWVFRPDAKREYPKDQHVLFMKECPNCYTPEGM